MYTKRTSSLQNRRKTVGHSSPRKTTRIQITQTLQRREWGAIRTHLAGRKDADKTRELLNRCEASSILRRVIPYTSIGRIGLGLPGSTPRWPLIEDDSPCLYFHNGYFTVSSYDNMIQWRFATAVEAIMFVEQHLITIPAHYSG
jgi:hypothetical protein